MDCWIQNWGSEPRWKKKERNVEGLKPDPLLAQLGLEILDPGGGHQRWRIQTLTLVQQGPEGS